MNTLVYKLGCLNQILSFKNIKSRVTIISLYFNDIEKVWKNYHFSQTNVKELKDLNLLHSYLDSNKINTNIESDTKWNIHSYEQN